MPHSARPEVGNGGKRRYASQSNVGCTLEPEHYLERCLGKIPDVFEPREINAPASYDRPLVRWMNHVSYDPLGFFLPLLICALYVRRMLSAMRPMDVGLFVAATGLTQFMSYCDGRGVHTAACYAVVLLLYACEPVFVPRKRHAPAAMLLPFFFLSLAIPDLYAAYTQGCAMFVTVGGDGLTDGLFLWPLGVCAIYGLTCVIEAHSAAHRRGDALDWRSELKRHFSMYLQVR